MVGAIESKISNLIGPRSSENNPLLCFLVKIEYGFHIFWGDVKTFGT